ncbi:MAG: peptidoglycan DD-metalloendopeptidase family protein [Acidobacteriota bacterium]
MKPLVGINDAESTTPTLRAGAIGGSTNKEDAKLRELAIEFESLILNQLTSTLQSSPDEDEENYFGQGNSDFTQKMFGEQLSNSLARAGGIGLAEVIMRQLQPAESQARLHSQPLNAAAAVRELRKPIPAQTENNLIASVHEQRPVANTTPYTPITRPRRVLPLPDEIKSNQTSAPYYTGKREVDTIIAKASAQFGLDPNLVTAVLKQESGGNRYAVSAKGAAGYMQLMPATFQRFAAPGQNIFDIEANISAGSAYLRFLTDKYDGNLDKVLAGYNAGEGNVDKYGGIPPFKETRIFVESVKEKYQKLSETIRKVDLAGSPQRPQQVRYTPIKRSPEVGNTVDNLSSTAQSWRRIPVVLKNRPYVSAIAKPTATREENSNRLELQLPVQGRISSVFGAHRPHGSHKGIDIAAPQGKPISAAAAGRVVFAGWQGGYGKTLLIEHQDGYLTRYAHADQLLVSPGEMVQVGQQIATIGSTGHATGPHLHFEVIKDNNHVNPLRTVNIRFSAQTRSQAKLTNSNKF